MVHLISRIKITLIIFLAFVVNANPEVYLKKDQALELAFPDVDKIEKVQVFLNSSQVDKIESRSNVELDSRLYVFYKGVKNENVTGYAVIDTHILRTKTETVLYVIEPDGKLRTAEILAFFEPTDYQPGNKWLDLYKQRDLDDSFRIGRDIPNITGATITSHAFARSVSKILAIFEVAVQ